MVVVVQLVRTPDCGSGGRRFESGLPPFFLGQNVKVEEYFEDGNER
tara:strand:- start:97 stop:234 length:138 start_codon:yes stop_codon:yes gene_type:complete